MARLQTGSLPLCLLSGLRSVEASINSLFQFAFISDTYFLGTLLQHFLFVKHLYLLGHFSFHTRDVILLAALNRCERFFYASCAKLLPSPRRPSHLQNPSDRILCSAAKENIFLTSLFGLRLTFSACFEVCRDRFVACRRSCAARSEAQGVLAQIYGCEGEIVFGNIYRRAKVPDAAVSSGWPGVRALLRLRFASP